jgi:hypothetical protein
VVQPQVQHHPGGSQQDHGKRATSHPARQTCSAVSPA